VGASFLLETFTSFSTAYVMATGTTPSKKNDDTQKPSVPMLALAAIGVVFGDIATSPLYALQEGFGEQGVKPNPDNVLGLLSLCMYSLLLVVTGKYVLFVMRADNHGEGGMMALGALARGAMRGHPRWTRWIILTGLAGVALFFGDSVITPAISVLSAVEGLQLATPVFKPWIVPIAVVILAVLFLLQKKGSSLLGHVFAPVMLLWLLSAAALGIAGILRNPHVLIAANPAYAALYMWHNGFKGFASLGAVVLVLTGVEALYADIGHFGKKPIRLAWFTVALPALLLDYFGQGALLLKNPGAAQRPFYLLVPHVLLYPMIVLATCATIIASQAVVSGAFSMIHQGIQLGYLPRTRILHTSKKMQGQVYVPAVNYMLLAAVLAAVLIFRSSDRLGGAYGIAVSGTMLLTTCLFMVVARHKWRWNVFQLIAFGTVFLIIDGGFFSANLLKVVNGGWFPLVLAAFALLIMTTWYRGRELLRRRLHREGEKVSDLIAKTRSAPPLRAKGTAVFFTTSSKWVPQALLKNLKHNQVLHERNVLLHVDDSGDTASVPEKERSEVQELGEGFYWIVLRFGFSEVMNVSKRLKDLDIEPSLDPDRLTYFLSHDEIVADDEEQMSRWRKALFAYLVRTSMPSITYFGMPPKQLIEIGTKVDL
jgi:KUP system potassium uptake protein